MTNEDKAKQLYHEYEDAKCCGVPMARGSVAFNAAMEMAQWKDDYYKKLLDWLVKSGANADIITDYIENCI